MEYPLIDNMKRVCKKISAMQEAVLWYWQDSPVDEQVWYYIFISQYGFFICS